MSDSRSTDALLSRKRPLSRSSYSMDSDGESTTGSDIGDSGGVHETKLMRRERNRQTAKLNRDRKKEETRELQDTVQYLRRQNQSLQSELNRRPSYLAAGHQLLVSFGKDFTSRVVSALETLRARAESDSGAFYVINAASHFFPVVFASPAFVELTGYSMQEIIGQNCGFLSGLQTSRNERERLNLALQQGQDISATLLNYRRDGTMFWNNIHLANLHTTTSDGDEEPYLIVGLHTEVLARRGLQLDAVGGSAGSEKDDHVDSGPSSSHSHQSYPGAFYSTPSNSNTNANSGGSSGGTNSGSHSSNTKNSLLLRCCKTEQTLHDQGGHSEDDHTILHEILSSHQQGLSLSNAARSTGPVHAQLAQPSRGRGVLGVRTRAMLGSRGGAVKTSTKFNVGSRAFGGEMSPALGGPYHTISAPPSVYAQAHLQQLRCNSAMSVLTDCEAAASPTALHLNSQDLRYIDRAPASRSESGTASVASESGLLSHSFASASLAHRADTAFTSLATITPLRTPARAGKSLLGVFPALEGLSTGALRHLGVSSYASPAGRAGEVPVYRRAPSPAHRCGSAQSCASSNSSASSATSVRRNYFSALEEHMASEHHAEPMVVSMTSPVVNTAPQAPSGTSGVLGGAVFHPHSAFQPVRRVSISEGSPTATARRSLSASGYTTHGTASSFEDSAEYTGAVDGSKKVSFGHTSGSQGEHSRTQFRAPSQLTAQRTDSTDRESVELEDQELASYMDPLLYYSPIKTHLHIDSHPGCTSFALRGAGTTSGVQGCSTEEAAAMMWRTWEAGTSAEVVHTTTTQQVMHQPMQTHMHIQAPSTPVHVPFSPVGCGGSSLQRAYALLAGGSATPTSVAAAMGMGGGAMGAVAGPME